MDAYQTSIYTAILIVSVIIGTIIIYFVISIIRQQRHNQELYRSKISAEIRTLEKERSRIASDLHDELGPVLSSVKLKMNCLEINSEEDQAQLEKINSHIDTVMKRMREISNDLMPTTLLRKGLVIAVEESIGKVGRQGLEVNFVHDNAIEMPNEKSIHIYRIVQEIIHNTIKHANATKLVIEMKTINGKFILVCRDNGIGFDHSAISSQTTGAGLKNLLSRAELMDGEMFIESKANKGTEFIFEIPL